jgi:WhiB family transcriptional regulator, redox-sensing transcriptional regulator
MQMAQTARGRQRPTTAWGWQEKAACFGANLDLFFGADGERAPARDRREQRALRICAGCPVLKACREHALSAPESSGVWGGLTEEQLAQERGRRRQQVA